MKIGVNILNFGPDATPTAFRDWAQAAEALGYGFVMISDHVAITADVRQQYPAPFYDPFVVLAWIAPVTKRLEIGTTVAILPYRHPLLVARMASNIDQLSEGRLIFGVGVGWAEQEYRALGIPFHERGAIASEYLAAIHECWSSERASFHGKYVRFEDVATGPRPARSPRPPIWVGGKTDAALRRAVRYGDAWHPILPTLAWARERWSRLHDIAAQERKPVPAFCPRINIHIADSPLPETDRPIGHGDREQIRCDVAALGEMDAEYLLVDTYTGRPSEPQLAHGLETIRALADHVFPLKAEPLG